MTGRLAVSVLEVLGTDSDSCFTPQVRQVADIISWCWLAGDLRAMVEADLMTVSSPKHQNALSALT